MDSIIPRPLFSHQLVVSFGEASFDFYPSTRMIAPSRILLALMTAEGFGRSEIPLLMNSTMLAFEVAISRSRLPSIVFCILPFIQELYLLEISKP